MSKRLKLHKILIEILGTNGQEISRVYFQPPTNIDMRYPCIVYKRSSIKAIHANDILYKNTIAYQVIIIDANPDSNIPEKISKLPLSRFDRHYTADNLNHDVYIIFY